MIERIEVSAVGPDGRTARAGRPSCRRSTRRSRSSACSTRTAAEGVGATPSYSTGRFDRAVLESLRLIAPLVAGKDAGLREGIWHGLDGTTLPVLPGARSALDIALWDLVARRSGLPLYRLLGGARERLPAYASTPVLADARAYVEFVARVRSQGFRAVKFHAWCEPERDLAMLRAVHAEYGDAGMAFMHDAEQRYDRPLGGTRVERRARCAWASPGSRRPSTISTSTAIATCVAASTCRSCPPGTRSSTSSRSGQVLLSWYVCACHDNRRLHVLRVSSRGSPTRGGCGSSCRAGATR